MWEDFLTQDKSYILLLLAFFPFFYILKFMVKLFKSLFSAWQDKHW